MVDLNTSEFDLRDAADGGAWCQLLHPVTSDELGADEGKPARIRIQGIDSMGFEKALAKSAAIRAKEPQRRAAISDQRIAAEAEKSERIQARELADVTIGWEHIEMDGQPYPFSRENALRLYTQYKWIREQLIVFVFERANFAGNGSAPS